MGKVFTGSPLGHLDVSPALQGLKCHKQIAGAVTLILIIFSLGLSRFGGLRGLLFLSQLTGTLINTNDGELFIVGLLVEG